MHKCIYTYLYSVHYTRMYTYVYIYTVYIYTEECGDPVEAHA